MAAAGFRSAVLVAAIAAAGCTSVVADARTFEGTDWRVTTVNGQPAPPGLSLQFSGGQLGGHLGCNRFSGPYRVAGNLLIVRQMAMTQMACVSASDDGPDPMAFEQRGSAVFSRPMRMTWRSGRELTLSNAAGSISLERQR